MPLPAVQGGLPPTQSIASTLSEIDMDPGTPMARPPAAFSEHDEELTPRSASKRKTMEDIGEEEGGEDGAEEGGEGEGTPQSVPKRKHMEVLRDRANTLSQAILAPFCTPDGRKKAPSLTRSLSTRSLLSRSKSRSTRKTSRGYFGSPHMRFSSTSQLWSDSLGEDRETVLKSIPAKELKRREAVHELVASETQYVGDVSTIVKLFCEPMRKMEIISDKTCAALFANLPDIVALHTELCQKMQDATENMENGLSAPLLEYVSRLSIYGQYCANLPYAKHVLERAKKNDMRFHDFLEMGRDLPQTRRMDLWDLLDFPRRRLQRYPLLTKIILSHTPENTPEHEHMSAAIAQLEQVIAEVDAHVAAHSRSAIIELQASLDFSHSEPIDLVEDNQALLGVTEVRLKHAGKDVKLYLFAHVLLIIKEKKKDNDCRRVVVGEPIRLQFLHVEDPREQPDNQLKIKCVDPSVRRGSLRGIQRSASMSSKSHVFEFASPAQRSEWTAMLTSAKLNACSQNTNLSFV